MKLSPVFLLAINILAEFCHSQRLNQRQDVINEWIRTIREAPKGHSMSPSWSSKQRPEVIGVGALPLQNEAVKSAGPPFRSSSSPSFPSLGFKLKNPLRPKRYSQHQQQQVPSPVPVQDYSRPSRGGVADSFQQNKNLLSRYHEIEAQKQKQKFTPLQPQGRPQGPKKDLVPPFQPSIEPIEQGFPSLKPFGSDDFGFTRAPIEKRPAFQDEDLTRPDRRPFNEPPRKRRKQFQADFSSPFDEFHNGDLYNSRPAKQPHYDLERPKRKLLPNNENFINEEASLRPFDDDFFSRPFNSKPFEPRPNIQQFKRPKRKRPQFIEEPQYPFVPHDKPTQYVDFRAKPKRPLQRKRFEKTEKLPIFVHTTTPRPIPTPGPMDFPRPPPRRPRPPPTHPTHPPLITHPPEHYDLVTKLPPPPVSQNEVSDAKIFDNYKDYDYNEQSNDVQDEGFFSYPGTFPSLEQLGAGFESMKIRNKRSAQNDPMMTSEARNRRLRNRRRLNGQARFRRNQARQGFGFQNNFWGDAEVDSDDFFNGFGNRYDSNSNYDYYNSGGRGRDPYTEQTIQSYPAENNNYYNDPYSGYGEVVNNEILGSGNFDVVKGGTFYDEDTYYYSSYNRRPQYGEQLFENFRDFADIKNDRYRYPKY